MSQRSVWLAVVALAFGGCGSDSTGPDDGPLPPGLTLALQPFVTTGLASPVFMAQPRDDGRIFVVEQAGRIRVVRDGVLQATPFLDISARVASGGERGLLSVAFHPQYETNRFFFVYFTALNGDIRIERYTTTAGNPEVADAATMKLIITTPHPAGNHNGGLVTFGPDAMLWAAFGDGGGGVDPDTTSQNLNSVLGSLLRININTTAPYEIPANNPYVGMAGRRGEIWAKGLRNPWRFAIDEPTGILYIADVGQNALEEVNARPFTTGGLNYGWNRMEGLNCYPPGTTSCNQSGLTLPVIDYPHGITGYCSVTGGYVYRGTAIEGLQGHYLYSDYCGRFLSSFRYSGGEAVDRKGWNVVAPGNVSSFGVDFAGEIYMIAGASIYRIVAGT